MNLRKIPSPKAIEAKGKIPTSTFTSRLDQTMDQESFLFD